MERDWRDRLLTTTRGRLIALLRRSARTVNELAARLKLTDNAVRAHLASLERDGLVEQAGTRRGGPGKPAHVFRLTPGAESLFPKAYAPVLATLLAELEERLGPAELESVLHAAGERLAGLTEDATGTLEQRAQRACAFLNAVGGLAEVESSDRAVRIQGYSCPLGDVTRARPELCELAESLVSAVAGVPARQCCEHGERPRCAFVLESPAP